MCEPAFTTSQAAAGAGLSRKALRLYEQRGLLAAPERTAAGYRRYTRTDIDTLIFIRRARALGLRVEDIAAILALRRDGRAPCDTTRALLDQRIHQIDTTLAELTALRAALARAYANELRQNDDQDEADFPRSGYVCPLIERACH